MFVCVALSLSLRGSDVAGLFRPIDYEGSACGYTGSVLSKPKMVYPKLAEDLAAAYQDGAEMLSNLQSASLEDVSTSCGDDDNCDVDLSMGLYGICVASCPEVGDIVCTYAVEAALATETTEVAQQQRIDRADDRDSCWFIDVPLEDKFDRCVFYDLGEVATDFVCVEANFTTANAPDTRTVLNTEGMHGQQISYHVNQQCQTGVIEESILTVRQFQGTSGAASGLLGGLTTIFSNVQHDLTNCKYLVFACGIVLACALAFTFVSLVSQIAFLLVWLVLFFCWVVQLVFLFLCAKMAGWIDYEALRSELLGNVSLTEEEQQMHALIDSNIPSDF